MNSPKFLIRVFSGGHLGWVKHPPPHTDEARSEDVDKLIKGVFDLEDDAQSVYEVDRDEEIHAVAAHLLTAGRKPKADGRTILRIRTNDLERLGIKLSDKEWGSTGVPWIDFRHRDLIAEPDQLKRLISHIACQVRFCLKDRIRRIEKELLKYALTWLGQQTTIAPQHVRENALAAVNDSNWVRPRVDRLAADYLSISLPDEMIRPGALARSTGDQEADWKTSTDELRDRYVDGYRRIVEQRWGA